VIAINADKTEQDFKKKLAYYQWQDNYCDFTRMSGENFTKYGVLSVPLFFAGLGGVWSERRPWWMS
jgi:hypothetical protein